MRPFLSACFALSAALAVAACQSGEDRTAPAADPGCIQVSPATHPPCHADNPCALIRGEIDRSCKLWDKDPPAECRS